MYPDSIKDGGGGLDRQDSAVRLCPRMPYDPGHRALVAYSRGKRGYGWLTAEKTIRSWIDVFEEEAVDNAYAD